MMEPPIDELLEKTGVGKYGLIVLSAKRARQILSYYNQLGEGLGRYIPPQVVSQGKPLSIALEEIAQGKVVPKRPAPAPEESEPVGSVKTIVREADVPVKKEPDLISDT